MSTWLYTYNAKKWDWEMYGFDTALKHTAAGKTYREGWRTLSVAPKKGDSCFIVKLGKAPRGIFAYGEIASECYIERDVYSADKSRKCVDIDLKEIIDYRSYQILDMQDLLNKFPDQKWNPMSSGISIREEYCDELRKMWTNTFNEKKKAENKRNVICLPVKETYDLVTKTRITAHPDARPYPLNEYQYIAPIMKGGKLEVLYEIRKKISCYPNEVYDYKESLTAGEYNSLIEYHERRNSIDNFGYNEEYSKYTFYVLGTKYLIKQPYIKKHIRISLAMDINDIPLVSDDDIGKMETLLDNLELKGEERMSYIKIRVNQGIFRKKLLHRYGCCCLCGISNQALLRASHIKPWADSNPDERLNVDNGLLLCPNHDALFDKNIISFDDNGEIIISSNISANDLERMNIKHDMKIELTPGNKIFMEYHRKKLLKNDN